MSSLDFSLRDYLSRSLRSVAMDSLWGLQPSPFAFRDGKTNLETHFELYFRYYSQQCDLIGRYANGKYSSVETHRDIMDIAQLLQKPLTREEVRKRMSDFLRFADMTQHENSINLVARLLLMIKIGNVPHECLGGKHIEWQCGDLRQFMHKYFCPAPTRGHDRIKLEKSFNALNVQRIAGIQIWWTDNLADHLRMMDDDKAVFIFHHASFLEYQLQKCVLYSIINPARAKLTTRAIAQYIPPTSLRIHCGRWPFSSPDMIRPQRNGITKQLQILHILLICNLFRLEI